MKPPLIIGAVLGLLVVLVWVFVPTLQSESARAADAAGASAELARRQMSRYSPTLPVTEPHVALDELKDADLSALESASSHLRTAQARIKAQAEGEELEPNYVADGVPAGEMRKGIAGFEALLRTNRQLLVDATAAAGDAARTPERPPQATVDMILGMAHLLEGEAALNEALHLRSRLSDAYGEIRRLGAQHRLVRIKADYFEELEIEPILDDLREGEHGREWISAQAEQAHADAEQLAQDVAQREEDLAAVQEELRAARDERLRLEEEGFRAGDDAAFARFREQCRAIFGRLDQLQTREQNLLFGRLSEDDDEPVLGLDELRRKHALHVALAERYDTAITALDDQIEFMQTASAEARAGVVDYTDRLNELMEQMQAVHPVLKELANAANNKEEEALRAAHAARDAFVKADSAIRDWKSAARETRTTYDPQNKNERLDRIVGDRSIDQYAKMAEAAARMLEGRIHAQRLDGFTRHRETLVQVSELVGAGTFDDTVILEGMDTARTEGETAVNRAIEIYDAWDVRSETKWIAESSKAAAYYLLSKLLEQDRDQLQWEAARIIYAAVDGREQSPYVADQVIFRNYLVKKTGYTPEAEVDEAEGEADDGGFADPNDQ